MTVAVKSLKKRWMKEPGFRQGYDELAAQFELAGLLIEARTGAGLSQHQLAKKMGTSQSTVARLESGAGKPSLSTLERFAAATGMKVRVSFEPLTPPRTRKSRPAA